MKRLLILILILLLLTGCSGSTGHPSQTRQPDVILRYYTIGREDPDLDSVNEKLNEILVSRYGFGVDYRKLDWNSYEDTVNGIINTNGEFDILFTWDSHYTKNAGQGIFLDLTPYLEGTGAALKNEVDERLWQGTAISGKIFGVPTNKELAPVTQFLFSRELTEKYHIIPSHYTSIQALEPLLAMIHAEEPNVIPLMFTSERINLAELIGYEYVAGSSLPFVVKHGDPSCRVRNLYETEEMQDLMAVLHRFYELGYINEDASVRTAISRFSDEQVFCRISMGGPDSERSFSVDFGYPIVTASAGKPFVTNSSARGGIMAISAKTPHPKEALTFLSAVNLDPEIRNLLNFGIEGIHYKKTRDNQIRVISDGYRGVPYTQGNWFILHTMEGENLNKWEQYRQYNAQAESSFLLGFDPDLTQLSQMSLRVSQIYLRYDNPLLTGSADPAIYRTKALQQMELFGADTIQRELQSQVDAWLRTA